MYLTTFKLKDAPFEANPDARYLYLSKAHARAKAYLESAVSTSDDFVVITGEEGSGKTLLVNTFRLELDKKVAVAHLTQAPISSNEFLQALLEQFGYIPFRGNKAALLATLKTYLAEQRMAGRKVLLLIDEAQNLAPPLLEQLRTLLVTEPGHDSPMRVILVGRPALGERLDTPEMAQLAQRARLRFHLPTLSPDQTHGYIVHRLAIAGSYGREIFQPESFEAIDRYTGGAPRLINALCDAALRTAGGAGRDQVLSEDVEAAALELKLPALSERSAPQLAPAPPALVPESHADTGSEPELAPEPEPAGVSGPSPAPLPLPKDLAGPRVARLRVMSGGQLVVEHSLRIGRMMIGRAADADLQIDDRTISRHHCQIISTEFLCVIQDLNSTNGLYVRDR
ncbi:MAG TPA: AAA family ATPase, partial [Steroidobacteraceae bacterium]|nr:AAA family ATPase [Steroidobacteraceae bacterium]